MRPLRKIGFLLEEFSPGSPAQQLLDRFLIGYPRDGLFHKPDAASVSAYLVVTAEAMFGERPREFNLVPALTAEDAVKDADAIVIVPRRPGTPANEAFLRIAVERAPEGAACFVHGVLANSLAGARHFAARASARRLSLLAGTPLGVTWRLPPVEVPMGAPLAEALIVVQVGAPPGQSTFPPPPGTLSGATLFALEGLMPVLERRRGGEAGIRSIRFLQGQNLWRAGDRGLWSWPLLGAALSRSHSPQGDPVADGRTQDLVGLGLVPKLARQPRGWCLEHVDGLRTTLLVLDGVVADINFAVRTAEGAVLSAQLFRAPPPAEHHYSLLTGVLEDFFRSGRPPWPIARNVLIAGLLERFGRPASLSGRRVETPELKIAYRSPIDVAVRRANPLDGSGQPEFSKAP